MFPSQKHTMNLSWEDIACEMETEYMKVKEALEECWDEIDRLEQCNAYQQQEIAHLNQQLQSAQELSRQPNVSSAAMVPRNSMQSKPSSSSIQVSSFLVAQEQARPTPPTQPKQLAPNHDHEGLKEDCHFQTQLQESHEAVRRMESEVENMTRVMQFKLEEKQKEIDNLHEQNSYLEDKIISLQSFVASYLQNEASKPPSGHDLAHFKMVRQNTPHVVMNDSCSSLDDVSYAQTVDSCCSESSSSLRTRQSSSTTTRTLFSSATLSNLRNSLPMIIQQRYDPTANEKELLRQLEYIQKEKRMDVMELEGKVHDRDAMILKYQRTIAMQNEALQNLQRQIERLEP